ncbi:dTDP-4-amino-4,6-dideoxygalactose transaminase [Lewinella sp. LCG006]|uniref:dTDP-4-amino-4,6-dideoxygalactose transaminase n=1 Tax=Lewinella sp. LCG006 TaxID=3231911 RepID=UPI0034610737
MITQTIPFHLPYLSGEEDKYLKDAIIRRSFSGNGFYTKLCEFELKQLTSASKVLLTSSCTHALEMCALLLNIEEGDEVIMSSFNFVSAANAFVLRGAKIVFVDVDPKTMNIDPLHIPEAITERTKVILAMHYGGVACDMEAIMGIAKKHGIKVVEDAAHCIDAYWNGQHLGTIGDLGTISFHATKNIHCGEGGALLVNNDTYGELAEIIREKGTNRTAFQKGFVDKYRWIALGSSYLMSELNAAFLYSQIINVSAVTKARKVVYEMYHHGFEAFNSENRFCDLVMSNAHVYYLINPTLKPVEQFAERLLQKGIQTAFHYPPLHKSPKGVQICHFSGEDVFTTKLSRNLIRLPIYSDLNQEVVIDVVKTVNDVIEELN